MTRRSRAALGALAVVAVLATGCASMPSSGPVHVGRAVPAAGGLGDLDLRVLPAVPVAGMTPSEIVSGFLHALVNDESDYIFARSYLSAAASESWRSGAGVTTYDDSGLHISDTRGRGGARIVTVTAPRIGRIDQRGDYTLSPGTVKLVLTLVKEHGEWRIDRLPAGVLLSALDAQRSFRLADVYFMNRSGTAVVPEQLLVASGTSGITTALVRSLLAGPGKWLAPAVVNAAPQGTQLLANVPVDQSGVAEVNLSAAVRAASGSDLQELSAQIVWTLRQVAEVTAVRMLVEGSPLVVPGVGPRQPLTAWAEFAPAAAPSANQALMVTARGVAVAVGDPLPGLARSADGQDMSVALSADGRTLAVVRAIGGQMRLDTGRVGGTLSPRLSATTITPPTFDPDGDVLAVVTRGSQRGVIEVTPAGAVRPVATDLPLTRLPVQQLRVSRDGARVAAVVGAAPSGELLVGRVSGGRGTLTLSGFRAVLPSFSDIRGVSWAAADELVVTAAANGGRQVVGVDVDGYASRVISTDAGVVAPVDVAAAPNSSLIVAAAGGTVWVDGPSGWRRVGRGHAPVYAD